MWAIALKGASEEGKGHLSTLSRKLTSPKKGEVKTATGSQAPRRTAGDVEQTFALQCFAQKENSHRAPSASNA